MTTAATEATVAPPRVVRMHLAIVHPQSTGIMVQSNETGGAQLPFIDVPNGDPRFVGPIADYLGSGLRLVSLGQLAFCRIDPAVEAAESNVAYECVMLCEITPAPDDATLATFAWADAATVKQVPLRAELKDVLVDFVEWLGGTSEQRLDDAFSLLPPHCLPGSTAVLQAESGKNLADCKQLQSWVLSSVWLDEGTVTKITCPIWPQEPAVTAFLHELAPRTVPAVLKHGPFRVPRSTLTGAWMVMQRLPLQDEQQNLWKNPPVEELMAAVTNLQAAANDRQMELRNHGALVRRPQDVAADLNTLWEEVSVAGLAENECEQLPALDKWLKARLAALDEAAPLLLTHGDLHYGNVLLTPANPENPDGSGSRLVIFDWTDAALSWAGVDLATMLGLAKEPEPDELANLKGAYVRAARMAFNRPDQADSLAKLEATLDEGTDLALVYHAVSYANIICSVPRGQRRFVGSGFIVSAVQRLLKQLPKSTCPPAPTARR